jgi:hypothetical protein
LRIEARQWSMSKALPEVYGDINRLDHRRLVVRGARHRHRQPDRGDHIGTRAFASSRATGTF